MSDTGDMPQHRYTPELAQQIEIGWQDRWESDGTFHAANPRGPLSEGFAERSRLPKLFVMDMFPYPSGAGMHVGNTLGYIGTDVYSRYQRMIGHHVLHTMGFDSFGLPAEQYAVQTGQHPGVTTEANIATYRRQLRRIGMDHDRRRSIETTDPDYYRWTQWIFLQIFNSWYDTAADKARPIIELIEGLDAGTITPLPGTNPFDREWMDLSIVERNEVVDNHRLAVSHRALVNWCPGLGTVLSNEEVTADGRSERGNFPVFRRPLKQWMMRITAYAERLLNDLDTIEWPDSIKLQQRNWIGRSTGAHVSFGTDGAETIDVFTTRPDTLFGATYMVLAPEHPLVDQLAPPAWPQDVPPVWTGAAATPAEAISAYRFASSRHSDRERQSETREKTGVFTGAYAVNPVNNQRIPIFIADYVLMGYGTGAIMAVPAQDQRDWDFATVFSLPIVRTVQPPEGWDGEAYVGEGPAVNSQFLDGLGIAEAKERMTAWLEEHGRGRGAVTFRLRDWLFSRQRYWGEPFPIVYDENDRPHAVPDSMLPVTLPDVEDYSPKTFANDDEDSEPEAPLSRAKEWVEVELDLGDGPKTYRRDTNTMPNWAGSCWYHLRYVDPVNDGQLIDPENDRYWMGPDGVDLYVGGAEHAVLHLLYARFWHKVLFDLGHVATSEPYHRLVNQGMLQLPAYTDERGFYVEAKAVQERDGEFFYDGEKVRQEIGKIGKSLKNVVTPDDVVVEWGADTFRLYEMFTGPLDQSRPWDPKAISGMLRLLQRIWRVVIDEETGAVRVSDSEVAEETARMLHRTIAAVREGYESLRFNTSIARITELSNYLTQAYARESVPAAAAEPLVLMLAPLAPHIAEELWSRLGHADSLAWQAFPQADPALLVQDTIEIPVQVNGKVRGTVQVAADADRPVMEETARAGVAAQLEGKTVRKVIVVPGRLVNFVVG